MIYKLVNITYTEPYTEALKSKLARYKKCCIKSMLAPSLKTKF